MSDDIATVETTETAEPSIDMAAAVDKISADLFPQSQEQEATPTEAVATAITETPPAPTKTVPPLPTLRQAPKSWDQSAHPIWEKIDPKAQAYIEKREKDFLNGTQQYREQVSEVNDIYNVLAPYRTLFQSKNLTAKAVVHDLLSTYAALTQGTPDQRVAAYKQIATNLQIPMPTNGSEPAATPVDPRIQALEQQFQTVQQALVAQQQAALTAANEKATAEVTAFADDPAHAHFDECFEEIITFIKAGHSLQEAYNKAVRANEVTYEKERQAWFQTETEKARERARLDALPKQKARGVNVKSSDTQRPPTEPLGSMEETLRSTLKGIKERTVH